MNPVQTSDSSPVSSQRPHELGLAAAARALSRGEITAEGLSRHLLERARAHAGLNAFITIDEIQVLEAARQADQALRAGHAAPLLGVPIGIKDSYLTRGLTTTLGTSVLSGYRPEHDSAPVAALKAAGALVFGKNNLVEMSYGVTGHNAHHGQVHNPHDHSRVSGGSSSGGAAAVAARLVPAAMAGDTVGSIRIPAALCGVVGFKPTPGRWPGAGVAPISATLDTTGLIARHVEDCDLVDALFTGSSWQPQTQANHLRGVRLAYAPRQHLASVDRTVEAAFRETLRKLRDAGAELVEIDLGEDFLALGARATWPVFLHETQPDVRAFLAGNGLPVSFEQVFDGLGEPLRSRWAAAVLPSGANYIPEAVYRTSLGDDRAELRRRFDAIAFASADALIFPTTPIAAPRIAEQWSFEANGSQVTDLFLAQHTCAPSAAGLAGISLPMGTDGQGLPLGIEIDVAAGRDRSLLALAQRIEAVIGSLA